MGTGSGAYRDCIPFIWWPGVDPDQRRYTAALLADTLPPDHMTPDHDAAVDGLHDGLPPHPAEPSPTHTPSPQPPTEVAATLAAGAPAPPLGGALEPLWDEIERMQRMLPTRDEFERYASTASANLRRDLRKDARRPTPSTCQAHP